MTTKSEATRTAALGGLAILAAACAATPAQAAPSQTPVTIGIIDARADGLVTPDAKTTIQHRRFAQANTESASLGKGPTDPSRIVASAFVSQVRAIDPDAPIKILSANILQTRYTDGKPSTQVNWTGARQALDWFKEQGVRVVMTSFSSDKDTPELRAFAKQAEAYGMVIFAPSSEKASSPAFPAAYPQAIAVSSNAANAPMRANSASAAWVDLVADGSGAKGAAVARAAAYGAYFAARNPHAVAAEIDAGVRNASVQSQYAIKGEKVSISYLDQSQSPAMMRRQAAVASPAKGPADRNLYADVSSLRRPGAER